MIQSSNIQDIALLYAEPLVKRVAYGLLSMSDGANYHEKTYQIFELLRSKEKQINILFETASIQNFVSVLSTAPKVLHILCQCEFNRERNEFYLCFEEEGRLKELYCHDLTEILSSIGDKPEVVIIHSSNSENAAEIFIKSRIPCIIAVNSDLTEDDPATIQFLTTFYGLLLDGRTIEESFSTAKLSITETIEHACCCCHTHKPDCEWFQSAKLDGFEKSHYLHKPTCRSCPQRNIGLHLQTCAWAVEHFFSICTNADIPEGDNFSVCCCSPELSHNENIIYKLFFQDESHKKKTIFQRKEHGIATLKTCFSSLDQKFATSRLTGRNKEIYEIYRALSEQEKRLVGLFGPEGIGKSSLAKQAANYLFQRGYFKDKIRILYLDHVVNASDFEAELCKEIPGAETLEDLCTLIRNQNILFILEKADRFLEPNAEQFKRTIDSILALTERTKFIIITNNTINPIFPSVQNFLIREMRKIDAAKLLCQYASPYLTCEQRNVYNLADYRIFDLIPLTPQSIWIITEKLKAKSLNDIERDIQMKKDDEYQAQQTLDKVVEQKKGTNGTAQLWEEEKDLKQMHSEENSSKEVSVQENKSLNEDSENKLVEQTKGGQDT